MQYICYECSRKLHGASRAASEEIASRRDNGEKIEDMCVEYENEKMALLKNGLSDTERYCFLDAAVVHCQFLLSCGKIERAGWKRNYSGQWVRISEPSKDPKAEAAELQAKLEKLQSRNLWQRIFNKE